MSYCSQIALKTTTEGWIIMKRLNDKIEKEEDKPLRLMTVGVTDAGYYKISNDEIRWYDGSSQVCNFYLALSIMEQQGIPFVFIRIGEDIDDIEVRNYWTEDMPDELETFEPQTKIHDEEDGDYKIIMESGKDIIYRDLFTPPEEGDDS